MGRGRGRAAAPLPGSLDQYDDRPHVGAVPADRCWLCSRPLGLRVEWHHPRPKSRGGRATVPVHPICHRALHAAFSNVELAHMEGEGLPPASQPAMQDFLRWIVGKPPDFHAPTRGRKR